MRLIDRLLRPPIRRALALSCALMMLNAQLSLAYGPQQAQTSNPELEIIVIQGDQATHLINYSRQEALVVQARVGGVPAKGVNVTFSLPDKGPGGYFGTSSVKTLRVTTDKRGRAMARGFVPNREAGDYTVRITAEHEGRRVDAETQQHNAVSPTAKRENRKQLIAVVVAVGVLLGLIIPVAILNKGS